MGDGDRPKRSWREIDQMRDGTRSREERRPRNAREEAQAKQASEAYVKELDKLFVDSPGGAAGEELMRALRDAHGTPGLADACRAYRDVLGVPRDAALLSLFLDAGEPELVVGGIEQLVALARDGVLEPSGGLRSQLRILAQDFSNDIADAAEELLELL